MKNLFNRSLRWFLPALMLIVAIISTPAQTATTNVVAPGAFVRFAWDANEEPDIAGYKIAIFHEAEDLESPTAKPIFELDLPGIGTTTPGKGIEFPLQDGPYKVAALAYNERGLFSAWSEPLHFRVDSTAPAKPKGLRVVVSVTVDVPLQP